MKLLRLFVLMLLVALLPIEGTAATVGMCAGWGDPATMPNDLAPMTQGPACHERAATSTHAHGLGSHKCGQCVACMMGVALPAHAEWAPAHRVTTTTAFLAPDVPAFRFIADALERPPQIA